MVRRHENGRQGTVRSESPRHPALPVSGLQHRGKSLTDCGCGHALENPRVPWRERSGHWSQPRQHLKNDDVLDGSRIMLHKPNPKSRTGVTTDLLGVSGKLVAGMWFLALPEARSAESQPKVWARPPWQRIFGLDRASSDWGAIRRRKRPMTPPLSRGEPASGR